MDMYYIRQLDKVVELAADPESTENESNRALEQSFELLIDGVDKGGYDAAKPATFVRFAEVAFDLGHDAVSMNALNRFFAYDNPVNQFYVRALTTKALLHSRRAASLIGQGAHDVLQEAQAVIMQAFLLAEQLCLGKDVDRVHDYALLYNTSVHHWTVIRPWLRQSMRKHAITSLSKVVSTLRSVKEIDGAWVAKNSAALAMCYLETKESPKATEALNWAEEAIPSASTPEYTSLTEDICRLRAHITGADGSGEMKPPASGKPAAAQKGAATGGASDRNSLRLKAWGIIQSILTTCSINVPPEAYLNRPTGLASRGVNRDTLRPRLEELVKLLDASVWDDYQRHQEELKREALILAATASIPSGNASKSDVRELDLLAYTAMCAMHAQFYDLSYLCVRTVKLDRYITPVVRLIIDSVEAELSTRCVSTTDARLDVGLFTPVPSTTLQSLTLAASSSNAGADNALESTRGGRRRSFAIAMQNSFISTRTTDDRVVMLPKDVAAATTFIPSLSSDAVQKLLLQRRLGSIKLLKQCVTTALSLGQPVLVEYCSSVVFNLIIPLLDKRDCFDTCRQVLDSALDALQQCNSVNYNLLGRLYATLAHLHYNCDMLASAAKHIDALKHLDYASGSIQPVHGVNEDRPLDVAVAMIVKEIDICRAVYTEFETPYERAMQLIHQAQTLSDRTLLSNALDKIILVLEGGDKVLDTWQRMRSDYVALKPSTNVSRPNTAREDTDAASGAATDVETQLMQARVWLYVAELAVTAKKFPVAMLAVDHVLSSSVGPKQQILWMQCRACILRAQACADACATAPSEEVEEEDVQDHIEDRRRAVGLLLRGVAIDASQQHWWNTAASDNTSNTAIKPPQLSERMQKLLNPPEDCRALGILAPGTTAPLCRLKCIAIRSVLDCLRLGEEIGNKNVIIAASKHLWNAHIHVWQGDNYGSHVIPLLMEAVYECLKSLLKANCGGLPIAVKLATVFARYCEDMGLQLAITEKLGIAATNPFDRVDGACFWSLQEALHQSPRGIAEDTAVYMYAPTFDATLMEACTSNQTTADYWKRALYVTSVILFAVPTIFAGSKWELAIIRSRVRLAQVLGPPPLIVPLSDTDAKSIASDAKNVFDTISKLEATEQDWMSSLPAFGKLAAAVVIARHKAVSQQERAACVRQCLLLLPGVNKELSAEGVVVKTVEGGAQTAKTSATPAKGAAKGAAPKSTPTDEGADLNRLSIPAVDAAETTARNLFSAVMATQDLEVTTSNDTRLHELDISRTSCMIAAHFAAAAVDLACTGSSVVDRGLLLEAQRCASAAINTLPSQLVRRHEFLQIIGLPGYELSKYNLDAKVALWPASLQEVAAGTNKSTHKAGPKGAAIGVSGGLAGSVTWSKGSGGSMSMAKAAWMAEMAWAKAVLCLLEGMPTASQECNACIHAAFAHYSVACQFAAMLCDGVLVTETGRAMMFALEKLRPRGELVVASVNAYLDVYRLCTPRSDAGMKCCAGILAAFVRSCVADKQYTLGMEYCRKAFDLLPLELQASLWRDRLEIESRLGMDVTLSLNELRVSNPTQKLALWLNVARMSSDGAAKARAYEQALALSESSPCRPFVLLDFAEWLHSNGSSSVKVVGLLKESVDGFETLVNSPPGAADDMMSVTLSVMSKPKATSVAGKTRRTARSARGSAMQAELQAAEERERAMYTFPALESGIRAQILLAFHANSSKAFAKSLAEAVSGVKTLFSALLERANASIQKKVYASASASAATVVVNGPLFLPVTTAEWVVAAQNIAAALPSVIALMVVSDVETEAQKMLRLLKNVPGGFSIPDAFLIVVYGLGSGVELRDLRALRDQLSTLCHHLESCGNVAPAGMIIALYMTIALQERSWKTLLASTLHLMAWLSHFDVSSVSKIYTTAFPRIYQSAVEELGGNKGAAMLRNNTDVLTVTDIVLLCNKLCLAALGAPFAEALQRADSASVAPSILVSLRNMNVDKIQGEAVPKMLSLLPNGAALTPDVWLLIVESTTNALIRSNYLQDALALAVQAQTVLTKQVQCSADMQKEVFLTATQAVKAALLEAHVRHNLTLRLRTQGLAWLHDRDKTTAAITHGRAIGEAFGAPDDLLGWCDLRLAAATILFNAVSPIYLYRQPDMSLLHVDEPALIAALRLAVQGAQRVLQHGDVTPSFQQFGVAESFVRSAQRREAAETLLFVTLSVESCLIQGRLAQASTLSAQFTDDPIARYMYATSPSTSSAVVDKDPVILSDLSDAYAVCGQLLERDGSVKALCAARQWKLQCLRELYDGHTAKKELFALCASVKELTDLAWSDSVRLYSAETDSKTADTEDTTNKATLLKSKTTKSTTEIKSTKAAPSKAAKTSESQSASVDLTAEFTKRSYAANGALSLLPGDISFSKVRNADKMEAWVSHVDACYASTLESLASSLENGDYNIAGYAAQGLVDLLGKAFPVRATLALALHQSIVCRNELLALLTSALPDGNTFLQSLENLQSLKQRYGEKRVAEAPEASALLSHIQSSLAYALLDVRAPLHTVLSRLQPGIRVIVLDSSPDFSHLYCGVLNRGKGADGDALDGGGLATEADIPGVSAWTQRFELSRAAQEQLAALLRAADAVYEASWASTQVMSAAFDAAADIRSESGRPESRRVSAAAAGGDVLEGQLSLLLAQMEAFFAPLWDSPAGALEFRKLVQTEGPVLLLPSRTLSRLPLESLSVFSACVSIQRDLSLHFHAQRSILAEPKLDTEELAASDPKSWQALPAPDVIDADVQQCTYVLDAYAEEMANKASMAAYVQRLSKSVAAEPVSKEKKDAKKGDAVAAVDAGGKPDVSLVSALTNMDGLYVPKSALAWQGVSGWSGVPSSAAVQAVLRSNTVKASSKADGKASGGIFLYNSHGRLFRNLPPSTFLGVAAPACRVALLLDSVCAETSAQRLAQLDQKVSTDPTWKDARRSWETAALLSLCGVGSVITHQWASTTAMNSALLSSFLTYSHTQQGNNATLASWLTTATKSPAESTNKLKARNAVNTVLYGLSPVINA